ncbi:MAG: hypothetical protein QOJ57_2841, partial [Thermoleophilaceae bacterium]|nr:hypothetical protein [Thermoleophilaceae bacterium]
MAANAISPPRPFLLRPNALWGLALAAAGFVIGGRLGAP